MVDFLHYTVFSCVWVGEFDRFAVKFAIWDRKENPRRIWPPGLAWFSVDRLRLLREAIPGGSEDESCLLAMGELLIRRCQDRIQGVGRIL